MLLGLFLIDQNLVDIVWGAERPSPPTTVIRHHPLHVSGQSSKDKVSILQQRLKELNRPFVVISMLDEIAWLLNIRGSDIEYNPVVRSYVVIPNSGAIQWFLPHDISREMEVDVRNHLQLDSSEAFVVIRPYEEIESYLKSYTSTLASNSSTFDLSLSPSQLNWRLYAAIENSLAHNPTIKIKSAPSLITKMKSIKNEAELNGMRQCHVRDGAALTAYFAWLDRYMKDAKDRNLPEDQMPTEYDVAQVLETYRQKVEHYISPSFATISSYGPNGKRVPCVSDSSG